MITLKSDSLRIELSEPGEHPNDGCRFDRTGFISEVILDGSCHFTASEPRNLEHRSTGGRGLCCEYKADYSREAGEGEFYPKLGIGLIRKKGSYHFFDDYNIREFPTEIRKTDSSCEMHTLPEKCLGYAMESRKKISVAGSRVLLEAAVTNVGEKEIDTEEYCHNFLSIDGMAVSPDYHLEFPMLGDLGLDVLPNLKKNPCNFAADGKGIAVLRNDLVSSLSQISITGMEETQPFRWKMTHAGAKASVEGEDYIRVSDITLWSADHMLCPEILQHIRIQPGETHYWSRSWTFHQESR